MPHASPIPYLYDADAEAFAQTFAASVEPGSVVLRRIEEEASALPDAGHVIISGSHATLKRLILHATKHPLTIGIVPLPTQTRLSKILALPKPHKALLEVVATPATRRVDLLLCEEIPVLGDVRIGNTPILKEYEFDTHPVSIWRRLWRRIRAGGEGFLRHHQLILSTEKESNIRLSAIGVIGLSYNNHSWVANVLKKNLSATDGQLALIALSPTSLFEFFIAYPLRLLWRRWRDDASLPASWGYLKANRIAIESDQPLDVLVDDTETMQTPVTLRVEPEALALSVGEGFWEAQTAPRSTRNTLRLDGIPRDEESIEYLGRGLPLFAHASRERYATLFSALREEAKASSTYVVLLILSTVIATLGLFINSGSVIIGAMLLAPLMQPIVSLSMGILRQDSGLMLHAAKAITLGVALVLLSAMSIALMTPIHDLGSEMAARLSPTILDMLVAIASGIAAAYAKNNPRIVGSLVGVAIAVALVPPLAVAGIGMGWGSFSIFSNALLLFATNLVGIIFAAAVTFFVQGFSPIRVARRGIAVWFLVAVLLAVPLYHAFETMKTGAQIRHTLSNLHFELNGKSIALSRIEYAPHVPRPLVRCEVIIDDKMDADERAYLKEMIDKVVGQPVEVIVTVRYRL